MNKKILAIITVILLGISGVAAVFVLKDSDLPSSFIDYRSNETVKDFEGRDVPIPTSLDGGIITVGRGGAPRWLAYFPDEFESLVMVSDTLNVDSQGSLDYSYAYGDILTNVKTHSRDNMNDSEKMVMLNPSLILVDDSIYADNKELCNEISAFTPLAVVDGMFYITLNGFWTAEYKVIDGFKNQAHLYGKLLRNEEKADEIIVNFQDALDDIRSYCTEPSGVSTYVAGPVWSGSNHLTTTFNPYLCLELVGGTNTLGNRTQNGAQNLDIEEVEMLNFNRMIIEASTVQTAKAGDSEGVLKIVEKRNNDDDPDNDIEMFIVLPSVSHNLNPLCSLISAYHLASIEHGTLSVEDVREKGNDLFVKFYGEDRGAHIMEDLDEYYANIKNGIHEDICTDLFSEVEVKKLSNGKYIFTKKE